MATAEQVPDTRLKRGITGPLLYLFILGDVLGAGVYALVGVIAGEVGGAIWIPLMVALALALLTAGSYAELVTKYPKAGGAAVFAERAFKKPFISFLVGFCMLAAGVTSAAGLAQAFAGGYLTTFIDVPVIPAALVFLVLLGLLNMRGIKESVRSNVVMTVIEVSGLVLVIVVVGIFISAGNGDVSRVTEFPPGVGPATAVLSASLIAYYSFVGFEVSANVAEEVRDVSRVYPRALFGALLTAGLVYLLIGLASSIALPPEELAGSTSPLLDVVAATGAGIPNWLFSLVALVAVANGALLTMIMSSRITYGMSEQGLFPSIFDRVLPHRRTPWVAIIATTLVAMALTLTGGLESLAQTVVLLLLFVFLSTNIAVIVLRKEKVNHRHFRIPVIFPYLAIASCLLLLTQQSGEIWLRAGILLAVGLALFGIQALVRSRSTSTESTRR
ncbi:amino acid permease [Arthrobacter echini]|uniref:Amino acid permease n=1 Tax=Arthrobacter echini TaxID=1529066 RepID=A0A4S5EA18_9MICC|nr:APC family permease [Arthrobacter echini]THJ68565.1 amino acid permease [Arthrobacter echini]